MGRPITGDSYVSMRRGPVLSSVLDLINSEIILQINLIGINLFPVLQNIIFL
jgi:hypothetical protein